MAKISVIGSGGWGIALAILLHKNGHNLTIWSFDKKEAEELKITRENKTKLANILIPENIEVTNDLKVAVEDKDILVLAVPSKAVRSVSKSLKNIIKDKQIIVNVAKGLEEDTLETMTNIIEEELAEKNHMTKEDLLYNFGGEKALEYETRVHKLFETLKDLNK